MARISLIISFPNRGARQARAVSRNVRGAKVQTIHDTYHQNSVGECNLLVSHRMSVEILEDRDRVIILFSILELHSSC